MVDITLAMTEQAHAGFDTGVLPSLAARLLRVEAAEMLSRGPLSVSLVWVSDTEIRRLNKQYRQKDEATDVLSFSLLEGNAYPAEGELGELFISVDTLRRQAGEHGHDDIAEAQVLLVHGLLHLLGHGHESEEEFKQMLALEKKYLGDNAGLIERSRLE